MALSDIPEYQKASPADLIRADQWNGMQRLGRNSLRTHRHTRPPGTPPNDPSTKDEAAQITTNEIVDGAVTAAKLASGAFSGSVLTDGSVTTEKLADGAVTGAKIAPSAVGTTNIANNSITTPKLSFVTVNSGGLNVAPNSSAESLVESGAQSTKSTIYFPTLATTGSTGAGLSSITAAIVYRQAVGSTSIDVHIRVSNNGSATAGVIWQVLRFA
jgi:hypothetical protein